MHQHSAYTDKILWKPFKTQIDRATGPLKHEYLNKLHTSLPAGLSDDLKQCTEFLHVRVGGALSIQLLPTHWLQALRNQTEK